MPLDPALPKHLAHLLEKRQGAGRRKQDGAKQAVASSGGQSSTNVERRQANRRKSKQSKIRKA